MLKSSCVLKLFDMFFDFHVGGGSKLVYSHHFKLLDEILKNNKTLIDNIPRWNDIIRLKNN